MTGDASAGLGEAFGAYLAMNQLPAPHALQSAAGLVQQARAAPDQLLEKLLQQHGADALLLPLAAALPGTPAPALPIVAACLVA